MTLWAVNCILVFKNPRISLKNLSNFCIRIFGLQHPLVIWVSNGNYWLQKEKVFESQFHSVSLNSSRARNNVNTASTDDPCIIHDTAGLCYSLSFSTPVVFFHVKMQSVLSFPASCEQSERLYTPDHSSSLTGLPESKQFAHLGVHWSDFQASRTLS